MKILKAVFLLIMALMIIDNPGQAQQSEQKIPEPKVVTPGLRRGPPSDAIILFDMDTLAHWKSVRTGGPAEWVARGDKFTVKSGKGGIETKELFGDCQLHIEWKTPKEDVYEAKTGQENGNSGIYFMCKYEIQVLNSFRNPTDPQGMAGAYYGNAPPLVNVSKPAGRWQVYDIIFEAPEWDENENLHKAGSFTVFHNGVLIQNHVSVTKPTTAHNENYSLTAKELPLMLQDHGNKVSYRNIWIRRLN